jgi:hypothetical protein
VCRLREYIPSRAALLEAFPQALQSAGFELQVHGLLLHEHRWLIYRAATVVRMCARWTAFCQPCTLQ